MNGMKGGCRLLLLWLIDILGINALYRVVNRNKAIILWYHGVCDEGFKLTKRHIAKSVFRKQLSYLKRKGYIFITMSELLDVIKNKKKINKYAVLTFDDGFRNVVENAYPIMKEFGAKGCIYLVSDLIGTTQLLWTDHVETVIRSHKTGNFQFNFKGEEVNYRLDDDRSCEYAMEDIKAKLRTIPDSERHKHMEQFHEFTPDDFPQEFMMASWEQIRELDPEVLEAGSHTKRHPNCTNLTSDDEIKDEIYNSKIDIEKNTGHKIKHFCYPAGSYNKSVIAKVMEYGYESATSIEHGFNDENSDVYRLKRISISDDFWLFKAATSGARLALRRLLKSA